MKVLVAQSSMEFSRQEYWSELPVPSPGGLPDPGTEPESPALQAESLQSEPQEALTKRKVRGTCSSLEVATSYFC